MYENIGVKESLYDYKNTYLYNNLSVDLCKHIFWTVKKYGFKKVNWKSLLYTKIPDIVPLRRQSAISYRKRSFITDYIFRDQFLHTVSQNDICKKCNDPFCNTLCTELMEYCFKSNYLADYRSGCFTYTTGHFIVNETRSNLHRFKTELYNYVLKKTLNKLVPVTNVLVDIIYNYL